MTSVLFWNLFLKPCFVASCKNPQRRTFKICKRIRSMKQQPDVLCFCEVWDSNCRKEIIEAFSDTHPHSSESIYSWCTFTSCLCSRSCICKVPTFINGGILVLSKTTIRDSKFTVFQSATGWDALTQKGVLVCKIGPLYIAVTHLQSGQGVLRDAVREKQLAQIKGLTPKEQLLLCGDFNTSASTISKHLLLPTLPNDCKWTWNPNENSLAHDERDEIELLPLELDHFVCSNGLSGKVDQLEDLLNRPPVSDHEPILARIKPRKPEQLQF